MKDDLSKENHERVRIISAKPSRRYELDWLRVLVILNLIPFHAAWLIAFIPGFSHVPKVGPAASAIKYCISFEAYWQMPLLFFIAGATTFISLSYRSPGEYVLERIKRLLVPLIFFILILCPLMLYFLPGSSGGLSISDYLFRFWTQCLKAPHNSWPGGRPALPGWGHLWFVSYLLLISLGTLPLLLYYKKHVGRVLPDRPGNLIARRGAIFLPGASFVIVAAALAPKWPMFYQHNLYQDWAYFFYSLVAFTWGFFFYLDERFGQAVDRHLVLSLLSATVCSIVVLILRFGVPVFSTPAYNMRYFLYATIFGFNTWLWMLALLGLARRLLAQSNRFLAYFSGASYPFYILHLTLMIPIGHYVVQWRFGYLGEFLILCTLSFAATVAVYELLVRRIRATRFLLGMKA